MKIFYYLTILILILFLAGCGKSEKEKQVEQAAKQMEEAAKQMEKSLGEGPESMGEAMKKLGEAMSGGEKVEPVSFRELKKLLPESLPGLKRKDAGGEKTSAMGIKVSEAHATYRGDNGKRIEIKITDFGSLKGTMAMATMAWAMADFERETDDGYEKTTMYKGHKALEKYDSNDKEGEIQVIVGKRFMVEVEGWNVDMDEVKGALEKIDLNKLDAMKNEGVEK